MYKKIKHYNSRKCPPNFKAKRLLWKGKSGEVRTAVGLTQEQALDELKRLYGVQTTGKDVGSPKKKTVCIDKETHERVSKETKKRRNNKTPSGNAKRPRKQPKTPRISVKRVKEMNEQKPKRPRNNKSTTSRNKETDGTNRVKNKSKQQEKSNAKQQQKQEEQKIEDERNQSLHSYQRPTSEKQQPVNQMQQNYQLLQVPPQPAAPQNISAFDALAAAQAGYMFNGEFKPIGLTELHDMKCFHGTKIKGFQQQQKIVAEYITKHRGVVVWHNTGSGKTLTAILATRCILDEPNMADMKVIVITPKSVITNFEKEMDKYGISEEERKRRYTFMTINAFTNEYNKQKITVDNKTILVVDEAHNLRTHIKTRSNRTRKMQADGEANIKKPKNPSRAATVLNACKLAGKVILLTATPFYDSEYDGANLVSMVRGEDPPAKSVYTRILENDDAFKRYFSCVFSFYQRGEDPEHYPSKSEVTIPIPMSADYYRQYRKIEKKSREDMKQLKLADEKKIEQYDPFMFYMGLRKATNTIKPSVKTNIVMQIVRKMPNQKILVYSSFKKGGVKDLDEEMKKAGIKHVVIDGDMSIDARQDAVDKFNKTKDYNVMLVTKAGGEGLDLKGVRIIIHFESLWNRSSQQQINGRGVRYNSHIDLPAEDRNVTIIYLEVVKPNTIDVDANGLPILDNEDMKNPMASADTILRELTEKKQEKLKKLEDRLMNLTIENNRTCWIEP